MPLPNHKLIICGIPELSQHAMAGVSHVLSIIDTHEPRPPALDEFFDVDHELVHCHAGISRSQAAAAILMCQHAPGREEEAFLRLLELRKHGWPNTRMVEFADQLLKRDGALLRGLQAYRVALIAAKPNLRDVIRNI